MLDLKDAEGNDFVGDEEGIDGEEEEYDDEEFIDQEEDGQRPTKKTKGTQDDEPGFEEVDGDEEDLEGEEEDA